jgi:NAD(P)-dependent dehydrogenase (short-subunit alcohol dehydrogenase family)
MSLARHLRAPGIAVVAPQPGFVRTGMTNRRGDTDANRASFMGVPVGGSATPAQ